MINGAARSRRCYDRFLHDPAYEKSAMATRVRRIARCCDFLRFCRRTADAAGYGIAAAFIVANTLGMKYSELLLSAIIPAVIYYMGLLFPDPDEEAGRWGTRNPEDQLPDVQM